MNQQRYLTVEQASEYIQLSKWSLYKLVQKQRVPYIAMRIESESKPVLRFDMKALDDWMQK